MAHSQEEWFAWLRRVYAGHADGNLTRDAFEDFDARMTEHDAQVWDEGHRAGYADGTNPYTGLPPQTPNPYHDDKKDENE